MCKGRMMRKSEISACAYGARHELIIGNSQRRVRKIFHALCNVYEKGECPLGTENDHSARRPTPCSASREFMDKSNLNKITSRTAFAEEMWMRQNDSGSKQDSMRWDKMQDSFIQTGDFFKLSGVERVEPYESKPRIYSLINTLGWAVVTLTPMLYYLLGLFFSGELLYFSIACAIFGAFYYLLQKSIGMSKISHSSSYGAEKQKQ
ncbi:1-acyl-sn-glycerol-3-phosphate acyltransferase gamma [Eumeta japonica]|uniref:1-acyl-sn-glycerol-3-phosphate acyltransferase gamma n=1 Tax=Eumeta variegata TaxID=151549 RepID=A0A4C1XGW0_EUMVA|nr:1-acyl-sn-glycerol-3-phosphate acyltransferase gamma [Eumeta japonica]